MYPMTMIQKALNAAGAGPIAVDGIKGPNTTEAIKRFQKARGLAVDGIVGPNTTAALFSGVPKAASGAVPADLPWMQHAMAMLGVHEGRDKAKLSDWLRSDGATLGDPTQLPWCGDFVETAVRLSLPHEPIPENPYLARNWLKFGEAVTPQYGAILVFWRGSRSGHSGHVGFYAGESAKHFKVLGGNQSNAVTIATLDKARLLGAVWPKGGPRPTGAQVAVDTSGDTISTNEA